MHSPSMCMLTALTCSKKTHLWEIKSAASLKLLKPTGLGHISASFFLCVHRMMNTDWWHLQLNYRLQGKAWKDETPPAQSGCVSSSRHIHVKPACSVTPRSEAPRVKERALGNSSRVLEPKKKGENLKIKPPSSAPRCFSYQDITLRHDLLCDTGRKLMGFSPCQVTSQRRRGYPFSRPQRKLPFKRWGLMRFLITACLWILPPPLAVPPLWNVIFQGGVFFFSPLPPSCSASFASITEREEMSQLRKQLTRPPPELSSFFQINIKK